jgi:hypothetical protein
VTNSSWNNTNPWGPQGPSVDVGPGSYFQEYLTNNDTAAQQGQRGCINSSECGSGFACVNGTCVQIQDDYGFGGPCLSGGSDGGSGACGGSSAGNVVSCTTDTPGTCGSAGTVSGGAGCDEPKPIHPWNPPSSKACDGFCDSWGDSFGTIHPGCEDKKCPDCEECSIFGECERDPDGGCSCGSPKPNETLRCYKCGENGEWLADTCGPSAPKEEPEVPDCNPQSYCVENEVCITNPDLGTVTCGIVEQCSDLPGECEPCDCSCNNDCPACHICNASGVCEPDPTCGALCQDGLQATVLSDGTWKCMTPSGAITVPEQYDGWHMTVYNCVGGYNWGCNSICSELEEDSCSYQNIYSCADCNYTNVAAGTTVSATSGSHSASGSCVMTSFFYPSIAWESASIYGPGGGYLTGCGRSADSPHHIFTLAGFSRSQEIRIVMTNPLNSSDTVDLGSIGYPRQYFAGTGPDSPAQGSIPPPF